MDTLAVRDRTQVVKIHGIYNGVVTGDLNSASSSGASGLSGAELPVADRLVLEEALQRLKEIEQKVLYSFYYEDRSQNEIAQSLGVSNNYISHLLKNSVRQLQQMLRGSSLGMVPLPQVSLEEPLRLAFYRFRADNPPSLIFHKVSKRSNGTQRYVSLWIPVREERLFRRISTELSNGDEIEATVETRWTEDDVVKTLLDFSKVATSKEIVVMR